MNYHHLRYFWAVAHEGNLTRAAKKLNVSQSAVSVQIQSLEDDLGHALFDRKGRRLVLTEAGHIALEHADAIFAIGDELEGTLRESRQSARRALHVGALATLSRNFQIGFLAPLLGKPDIEVTVRSGEIEHLLAALAGHDLDVVLANTIPRRTADSPWIVHTIADQQVSLIGRPRHRTRSKSLRQRLMEEPLVLPTAESSIRTGFDGLVDRLGITPSIAAEIDDMAMLRLVAREHNGLSVIPSIVVKDEIDRGELVEVESLPSLRETFYAVTRTRRFPNPLLELVLPNSID